MRLIDADVLTVICKVREYDLFLKNATPESWAKAYAAFREEIDRMPTIEAEPVKRGKWTYHKINDTSFGYFKCSNCGNNRWIPNYCPSCGAKMEGDIE